MISYPENLTVGSLLSLSYNLPKLSIIIISTCIYQSDTKLNTICCNRKHLLIYLISLFKERICLLCIIIDMYKLKNMKRVRIDEAIGEIICVGMLKVDISWKTIL